MNLLKAEIFDHINKYIEQEVNTRYSEIIDRFLHDLELVLRPEQKTKLEAYLRSSLKADLECLSEVKEPLKDVSKTLKELRVKVFKELLKEFARRFYLNIAVKLDLFYSTYNYTRVEENSLNRCQARTSNGKQCTRAHHNNRTKLCGGHTKANPHGMIGQSNPAEEAKIQKRIQICQKTVKSLRGLDLSEYIKTTEIELDGKIYLLDDNGILYDQFTLSILAQIKDYKVYWFNKGSS